MSDKLLAKASSQYQSEWDRYDNQSADGCLMVLVFVGIAIATMVASRYDSWLAGPLQLLLLLSFGLIFFSGYRNHWRFKCPRCRKTFSRWRREKNVWEADNCENCDLPRYYGSRKFIDRVGVEHARTVAENFERWRG